MSPNPLQVIPNIATLIETKLETICEYDLGTKIELSVRNIGHTPLENIQITVLNKESVLSGSTVHRIQKLPIGGEETIDFIVDGAVLHYQVQCQINDSIIQKEFHNAIQPISANRNTARIYRFMEPRSLTKDLIQWKELPKNREIQPDYGYYNVRGPKYTYSLSIQPNDPTATEVEVFSIPGEVEFSKGQRQGKNWVFKVTVVESPLLTRATHTDYLVHTSSGTTQGEIHLKINPTLKRYLLISITAGLMITVRSAASFRADLLEDDLSPASVMTDLYFLMLENKLNSLQLLSIPLIFCLLWLFNRVYRRLIN
ncbi:MAG: hypothetical protein R3B84_16485 [Zavarzinella sp.]